MFVLLFKINSLKEGIIKTTSVSSILLSFSTFLNSDGYASENLRQQSIQTIKGDTEKFWKNKLDRILQEF